MLDYEDEYTGMLEDAFNFLFRKGKTINGSCLNTSKHNFIISNGGHCLHCGIKLTQRNSNTEHIHDRALGGANIASNKIIICKPCNLARNKTMQIYLGVPSYWRGFPGNWDRIKKYLLWNAVTVDKGHNYGRCFTEVHEIFEDILLGRGSRSNPPNSWYGRGDNTKIIFSPKQHSNGFFIRFFDKIFGYKKATLKPIQPLSNLNTDLVDEPSNTRKIIDVEKEFYHHIISAISRIDGEIKLVTFSQYFQSYLLSQGLPKKSIKDFARSFGIPKKRTFVEIIDDYFSDEISYRREGNYTVYISSKKQRVFQHHSSEEE